MKVIIEGSTLTAIKESGDPRFTRSNWCPDPESTLLYHIKNILNKQGYNLIKKRMWKDGHLVDELQHYLRPCKPSGNPDKDIIVYNPNWSIEGEDVYFNRIGKAEFIVIHNCFAEE